jgi:hypothetical protein
MHTNSYTGPQLIAGESQRTNMRDEQETNSGDTPGITHLRLL